MIKLQRGFTLIELIIVIVVGSILAVMTTSILTLPVNAYIDNVRRATLTDAAEMALRRMQRDIRRALPNSIRITNSGKTIELLHINEGGRYRAKKNSTCVPSTNTSPCNPLKFTSADISFDIIGTLNDVPTGKLVVYNLGVSPANAYADENVASIDTANSTVTSIAISPAKKFPLESPEQRFFMVDTPVTYSCDLINKQLIRYDGYTIVSGTPTLGTGAIQTQYISACDFSYDAGSSVRAGLVTISLALTDDANESITLIHQVHVDNQP